MNVLTIKKHRPRRFLTKNKADFFFFEFLFKLGLISIIVPLLYGALDLTMRLTGFRYLTAENIGKFIKHPIVFIWPIFLFLLLFLYTLFDISGVIYLRHNGFHARRAGLMRTIRFAFRNTRDLFKRQNIRLLPPVFVTAVYFVLGQIPFYLASVTVSSKTISLMKKNRNILIGVGVLLLFAGFLTLRTLFAFHYYTLENLNSSAAKDKSKELTTHKKGRNLAYLIRRYLLCYVLYILVIAAAILLILLLGRAFFLSRTLQSRLVRIIRLTVTILLTTFNIFGVPVGYLILSGLFYKRKAAIHEPVSSVTGIDRLYALDRLGKKPKDLILPSLPKRILRRILRPEVWVLAVLTVICCIYIQKTYNGEFNRNVDVLHTMEVTAHRGASRYYPENTMASFSGAVSQGADWLELDVHQSRDGRIFVMHDANFKRTCGVNAYSWELTGCQIRQLDAGSFFGKTYSGEQIPFLSEVIDLAKKKHVKLNIEIKPSEQEATLEQDLVALIEEKGFEDSCVVTSQYYDSVKKVHDLNDSIKTVYVMGLAYGNISKLEAADAFSVRHSSINTRLVEKVHASGKEIYAWTVDTREDIDAMLECGVDNIITDDVPLAKARIQASITSDPIEAYTHLLERLLGLDFARSLTD